MNPVRMIAITFGAFVTMAGAPGPDDSGGGETFLYDEQQHDLSDGKVPPEALDVQRPSDVLNLDDADASSNVERPAAFPEEKAERAEAAPTSAASDGTELELTLSDDYVQGWYFPGRGLLGFEQATGHIGVYFSDERDLVGSLGLMTEPFSEFREGLTVSAGVRGYLALLADPNDDVFGLAPGVQARYALPFLQHRPMHATGGVFYAPNILTFGDATDILDLDLRLEVQLKPRLTGLVGYREFRFDSDEGDDERAASEFQVGARFAL